MPAQRQRLGTAFGGARSFGFCRAARGTQRRAAAWGRDCALDYVPGGTCITCHFGRNPAPNTKGRGALAVALPPLVHPVGAVVGKVLRAPAGVLGVSASGFLHGGVFPPVHKKRARCAAEPEAPARATGHTPLTQGRHTAMRVSGRMPKTHCGAWRRSPGGSRKPPRYRGARARGRPRAARAAMPKASGTRTAPRTWLGRGRTTPRDAYPRAPDPARTGRPGMAGGWKGSGTPRPGQIGPGGDRGARFNEGAAAAGMRKRRGAASHYGRLWSRTPGEAAYYFAKLPYDAKAPSGSVKCLGLAMRMKRPHAAAYADGARGGPIAADRRCRFGPEGPRTAWLALWFARFWTRPSRPPRALSLFMATRAGAADTVCRIWRASAGPGAAVRRADSRRIRHYE